MASVCDRSGTKNGQESSVTGSLGKTFRVGHGDKILTEFILRLKSQLSINEFQIQ